MNKRLVWLMMGMYLIGLVGSMVWSSRHVPWTYMHNDFYDYWIAGKLMAANQPIYGVTEAFKQIKTDYSLEFHWATGYSYPPLLALIFQPISHLPPVTMAWIWFGMNCLLYGLLIKNMYRRYPKWWTVIFMLGFTPAIGSLTTGQINMVVAWGIYGWLWGKTPLTKAAGAAMAGIFKVYPILLAVPSFLRRQWRLGLLTGLLFGVGVLLPLVIKGPATTLEYATFLPRLSADTDNYYTQQSVNAVLARLTTTPDKTHSFLPPIVFTWFMVGLGAGLLGFLFYQTRRRTITDEVLAYIWIMGLTLMAGRMTFWNFLPTVFGQLYLLNRWRLLSLRQRWGLGIGCFFATVGWLISYAAFMFVPVETQVDRIIYTFLTSVGFLYGIIQLGLLLKLPGEKR